MNEVLAYIHANPGCYRTGIAHATGLDVEQVRQAVEQLQERCLAYQDERTRGHHTRIKCKDWFTKND